MAAPYASTVITGSLGEGDVLTGKQMRDVSPLLHQLYDQNALHPMTAITSYTMTGKTAKHYKVEWTKKDLFPHWDIVVTGAAAGATSGPTITNADYFKAGDSVECPQADDSTANYTNKFYVFSITGSTPTLHPVGGTTCAAIGAGMKLHILSDSSEELSTKPSQRLVKDEQDYNYIHFMRLPYSIGNIEDEIAQFTGSEDVEREEETFKEIKMYWERQSIFGAKGRKTGPGGKNAYFAEGLKTKIEDAAGDNVLDWSSGLTEKQFDEYLMEGPCKYGSQIKYMGASAELFLKIHEWAKAKQQTGNDLTMLGIALTEYRAPNGKRIRMFDHHMFEEDYEGMGLLFDLAYWDFRPYGTQGSFQLHEDIQAPDLAGFTNEWRIIATNVFNRTEPHGYIHA